MQKYIGLRNIYNRNLGVQEYIYNINIGMGKCMILRYKRYIYNWNVIQEYIGL